MLGGDPEHPGQRYDREARRDEDEPVGVRLRVFGPDRHGEEKEEPVEGRLEERLPGTAVAFESHGRGTFTQGASRQRMRSTTSWGDSAAPMGRGAIASRDRPGVQRRGAMVLDASRGPRRRRIALSRFCYRRRKTLAPQGPRK